MPIAREEEAERALGSTHFAPGARGLLISLFLLTICSMPCIQYLSYLKPARGEGGRADTTILELLPHWQSFTNLRSFRDLWSLIPKGGEIHALEKTIEQESIASQWLIPRVQYALTDSLGAGNEQVYTGRAGWLFYRPDVDYVIGPPFLDPKRLRDRERTGLAPDPIPAIVQFRDQLANRGITLVVLPIPAKPSIEAEYLSGYPSSESQNASFDEFKARLGKANVRVLDITEFLIERKRANEVNPQYLKTDTHWRPETMEAVAQFTAKSIGMSLPRRSPTTSVVTKNISTLGDVARMLRLPHGQNLYPAQQVTIHQVRRGNSLWRANGDGDVLLLGDSFTNIFSLEALGWGESAGFAEHLSRALGDRPLDCILRNSDGAFATREILSRELGRGRDRLSGKKLVIWEFAARELAFGDWKLLLMKLREGRRSPVLSLQPHQEITVTGTVQTISSTPRPNTVPYPDHIIALHLVDIAGAGNDEKANLQAMVYLWSMRDNHWTRAARFRIGDRVTLRLRPWQDVESQYDKFNRTEIDDPSLALQEPTWGEPVP